MGVSEEPGARARGRAASRQRILDAAVAEFSAKGFSATRAGDIAARAGVAVGTLYLHFGDKNGVARAVAQSGIEELRVRLRQAVERTHSTTEAAARAHATALVDYVADPGSRGRLLFATDAAGLRGGVLDAMAVAQEAHLLERRRDGYFRSDIDAAVAAQALVGMQARVLMWWLEDPTRASRRTLVDTIAKLRLSGIHGPEKKAAGRRTGRTKA